MKKIYTIITLLSAMVLGSFTSYGQFHGVLTINYTVNAGEPLDMAGSVYIHSGVIKAEGGTAWDYTVGNWGQDDNVGIMETAGINQWKKVIDDPYNYYSIPSDVTFHRIAFVFRNPDGTLEGKDNGGDFYIDFNSDGSLSTSSLSFSAEYVPALIDRVKEVDNSATISAYPNPSNDKLIFTYNLKENAKVNLRIFDVTGREMSTVVNENQTPSLHKYELNTLNLNNGVYFYKLSVNGKTTNNSFVVSH